MAMLSLPLAIRPHCLDWGTSESSKLIVARHYIYGQKVTHSLEKSDLERALPYGKVEKIMRKRSSQNFCSKVFAVSHISLDQTKQRLSTYLFRTEIGGQVKVLVGKKSFKYGVSVDVSSLQFSTSIDKLVLSWGIFRSDSSCLMPPDFQSSAPNVTARTMETPFLQSSYGRFALELDFEANQGPFYFSFLLKSPSYADMNSSEIRNHRKTNFCVPVGFNSGYPAPLGLSFLNDGSMNFAIFSRNTKGVVLCLYGENSADNPALEIDLDPYVNRSGDIWHASMDIDTTFTCYGYRCKGTILQEKGDKFTSEHAVLDPYAKIVGYSIPGSHGSGLFPKYRGQLDNQPDFDWSGDVRPYLPMEKLVVYRLNVARFTEDKSSNLPTNVAGRFAGITEKLHHFKDIGMNAVLLEPIFPFDEQKGPYFPCHFFSPTNLYGPSSDPVHTINTLKKMVKKLHANGMEVLLEVVFTHTADGGALQAIDSSSYYHVHGDADGAKKTALNCNCPIVQQMIVDSLRHWVTEFHIDGFCFMNASSLLRGFHGEHLYRPPLVEAIAFDPVLSRTKIIADSLDPHEKVPKEIRFPHWRRWAEMNSKFCNDVRNFLRGEGLLSNLATRLCGSGDIFSDGRGPAFSFNFIAKNFGLPLVDLVSFSSSELASHLSWNCGEEGPTNNPVVLEKRLKQIRNFLFILFVSLGVPVLNMGDECGQSSGGSLKYGGRRSFNWNAVRTSFGIQTRQFISFLTSLRMRRADIFQKRNFSRVESIDWHGPKQSPPKWDDPSTQFLAVTLKADEGEVQSTSESSLVRGDLFMAFNADDQSESILLPPVPAGMAWLRLVDTALPFPGFFSMDGDPVPEQMDGLCIYQVKSHSCALFEARRSS
ncbi:isoamylase 2, chloroplastic [Malania oleifera]|uniref:isoamylase 2, chloroplastic n=1 Tax=Malania oleifera TaxID=397392 RepID=UPI0025ADD70E|nr:isoamylase 2, chloroplastic [Malania oleifera]